MDIFVRIAGCGLIVIGVIGTFLAIRAIRQFRHAIKLLCIPLFLLSALSLDAGTGYVDRSDTSPRMVTLAAASGAPDQLILLFHGYNGSGQSLVNILGPSLTSRGTVVAFEPTAKGYNSNEVIAAAEEAIAIHQPASLILYGESLGGMQVMELLRRNPHLHPRSIVFNATPSKVENVKLGGKTLEILNLPVLTHGGLISTGVLRLNLAKDLRNTPSPEPDVDETTRQGAYDAMRKVTGPTAFDELRFIANFSPPKPGEFAGRVEFVSYLRAPSASDSTIDTARSSNDLKNAFHATTFADIPIPEWTPDLHCPTPERPTPLIEKILAVS